MVAHQQPQRRAGLRMPCLHGNPRAHLDGSPRRKHRAFQRKHVVPQILARMRHHRRPRARFQKLHSQHDLILAELAVLAELARNADTRTELPPFLEQALIQLEAKNALAART